MGHEIDLNKYNIRTDLILESITDNDNYIDTKTENYGNISVTSVNIDDESSKLINRKKGKYVTILFNDATDKENCDRIEEIFIKVLNDFVGDNNNILVIGLGNDKSTPDSLGPKVIDNLIITRHLFVLGEDISEGIKEVAGFCPGVMACTGIETGDYIKAVINEVKPNMVVVVDALAAGSMDRVNKSIQITDTGIHPGSGVGNMRKEISFDTLGVPTIAIGIPTVVESSIIVYDTMNYLFKHISYIKNNANMNKLIVNRYNYKNKIDYSDLSYDEKRNFAGLFGTLSDSDKKSLINEVLNGLDYNFIVTPKEVDFQIDRLSSVISSGINGYIHGTKVSN